MRTPVWQMPCLRPFASQGPDDPGHEQDHPVRDERHDGEEEPRRARAQGHIDDRSSKYTLPWWSVTNTTAAGLIFDVIIRARVIAQH